MILFSSPFKFHPPRTKFKILLLSIFLSFSCAAQFSGLKNYNVKDGLPSSEVYAMMQDASGYLWFTTDMGVSRFDGYAFKNYSTENGLADNTNFGLIQDCKGRIWFHSFSGKFSYYENEKIKTLPCNSALPHILGEMIITSIYVDDHDTIWAGLARDKILKIAPPWNAENARVISLKTSGAYLVLFSEKSFIYGGASSARVDLTVFNNHFSQLYTIPLHLSSKKEIRFFYTLLPDHSYIVTSDNTITRFNAGGIISQQKGNHSFICTLEENGKILAGTYDGAEQYENYTLTNPAFLSHLDKKVITAICRDHENGLWFCTEGNGVYCIPFRNFSYYSPADGLSESKISCVTKAGDKVVCGHLDGTISILQKQKIQSVRFNSDTSASSSTIRTTSLAYNGADKIYISTITHIFTFDLNKYATRISYPFGSKNLIYTHDQLLGSLQFRKLIKFRGDPVLSEVNNVYLNFYADKLYEDRSGKIWICPLNSIWSCDTAWNLVDEGKNIPMLNTRIVDVQQDEAGNMWMVSRGNGVIIRHGKNYFNLTQKEGLAGNMCRTIFIDSGNIVWVGTNNGLSKIEVVPGKTFSWKISSYTSKNGLLTNEVNNILRQDNKLWLIHNNGISVFDPDHIADNTSPPPVFITSVLVNEDTVDKTQNNFSVPHDKNFFNISFTGLSYKDPGHLEYRYKMEGLDPGWNYTNYTSIKYQALPPGSYRFIVFAKNNDGYWSERPAAFSFIILPAWWQTWTFRIIIILVILFVMFSVFKLRLDVIRRREQKKSALQHRIAAIELNALRAQMNPHFVFNAINSVQYFITNNDPDSSQKYLSKFARLIRYVVDNSRLTSIPVKKEIEALTLYLELEALRFGKRFEFEICVAPGVDTEFIQIPSMLVQPYVENSIWHGIMHKEGNGKIEISIAMKNGALHCTIRDNGIGRKRSVELKRDKEGMHNSVGMSNTKERLDIINQVNNSAMSVDISDVLDERGNVCGTNVEIHIPIS